MSPIIRCGLVPKQVKTLPKDWVILNFRSLVEAPLMMFKTCKGATCLKVQRCMKRNTYISPKI